MFVQPKNFTKQLLASERGFTLVELLTVMAILGIILVIAWPAYLVYMDTAEYSKAEMDLHNLKNALVAGEMQLPPNYSLPLTFSDTDGGPVIGNMKNVLPGGTVSPDLKFGVSYNSCAPGEVSATISAHMRAIPCNSSRMITWTRLCGGIGFYQHNVANPGCQ